jgi:hypothetical protein
MLAVVVDQAVSVGLIDKFQQLSYDCIIRYRNAEVLVNFYFFCLHNLET